MKRRSFLLTSGSALLSGTALSRLDKSTFALEFKLSTIPDRDPADVNSVLVDFSKFRLTPHYTNSQKDAKLDITIHIDDKSRSVSKTVSVTNGKAIKRSDLSSLLPVSLDSIDTAKESIDGEIIIEINHDSIGTKKYSQTFEIQDNPLINGLVAYYPMEKGNGSVLHDASKYNLGQINNATWNGSGKVGSNALDFNGNGYVDISEFNSLNTKEWTFSLWIYDTSSTDKLRRWLGTTLGQFNSNTINIREERNQDEYEVYVGNTGKRTTGHQKNTWQHYVVTSDGSSVQVYRNSDQEMSFDSTVIPENGLFIGGFYTENGDNEYTDGIIDDVRIYDRSLSKTEIESLYSVTDTPGTRISETDVPNNNDQGISKWTFNETSNTSTAKDSWSNNDGTIYGANYVSGVYDNSLEFPTGTSDWVDIEEKIFQSNNSYTISVWWNEYNKNGRGGVFQREPTGNITGSQFGFHFGRESSDSFTWYVQDKNDVAVQSNYANLNNDINDWTHFVGVFDATQKSTELYRNGVLVGSDQDTNLDPSNLGESDHHNTRLARRESSRWNGRLDDVRIYNKPLTESGIKQLFNRGSYRIY